MKNFNLDAILEAMLKMSERVSDLNFSVGRPPQVAIDGRPAPVNSPALSPLTPRAARALWCASCERGPEA